MNQNKLLLLLIIVTLTLSWPKLYAQGNCFVTAVDGSSVTIDFKSHKETYTLADPNEYGPMEVIINGQQKSFGDIRVGMVYLTVLEVKYDVIKSITLTTPDYKPKKT